MIYCGVDGGGTKTKIAIAKDDEILDVINCGPSSIDTVSLLEMKNTIENALSEFYKKHDIAKIDSIYLGLGGIATQENISDVNSLIRQIEFINTDAIVNSGNDITNAYYCSCSGRNNITLIIGTGSVAYGIDECGVFHRTSGISFKEGDFGSGYDLGVRALKYMSYALDKRIEGSAFTKYLLDKFSIESISSLINFYEQHCLDRTHIASLAKDVIKFYKSGDVYARKILDEATDEIMLMIKGVDSQINLQNREIGIIGGLGNCNEYFDLLKSKIMHYDNRFNVHANELPAELGSLFIAREKSISQHWYDQLRYTFLFACN